MRSLLLLTAFCVATSHVLPSQSNAASNQSPASGNSTSVASIESFEELVFEGIALFRSLGFSEDWQIKHASVRVGRGRSVLDGYLDILVRLQNQAATQSYYVYKHKDDIWKGPKSDIVPPGFYPPSLPNFQPDLHTWKFQETGLTLRGAIFRLEQAGMYGPFWRVSLGWTGDDGGEPQYTMLPEANFVWPVIGARSGRISTNGVFDGRNAYNESLTDQDQIVSEDF